MDFIKRAAWGMSALFLILLAQTFSAHAQTPAEAKSYYYPSIIATIAVNKDSTLSVAEQQTFAFTGNFHAGERDISLQGINAVTNISVKDITTGAVLTESSARLDDTDPASDGKFAVWKDTNNNSQDVEWYFNIQDATHTWEIDYTVHGAIAFDQSYDRLYWNIFSGYTVPVRNVEASVILPENVPSANIQETSYRTVSDNSSTAASYANGTFTFIGNTFSPGDAFTIDVTWPKGIVSEQAFWNDWILLYLPYLILIFTLLLCFVILFLWWLFAIKLKERPGNVIPQYEPPQNLRPAVAEVVATEKITPKGLAATIVDLAVRGWVRIDNDDAPKNALEKIFSSSVPSYRITAVKDFAQDADLKDYEKHYLALLFSAGDGKTVSTGDFKKMNIIMKTSFSAQLKALREEISTEANVETNAFTNLHSNNRSAFAPMLILIFVVFWVSVAVQLNIVEAVILSLIIIAATIFTGRTMTRRTAQGKILNDEWLGFKLYLDVAEKYQLQNLTPDIFEKYLPYAMIFGMEKKWASVFDRANVVVPAPRWYGGYLAGPAFSASAFSTSFSSSFTSAIASSVGGGGGGGFGGGGAGGGGGGGGGGAR